MSEKRGLVSSRSLSASDRIQLEARFQLNTTERERETKKGGRQRHEYESNKKEGGGEWISIVESEIHSRHRCSMHERVYHRHIVDCLTDCMCATDFDLPPFLLSFHTSLSFSLSFLFLFFFFVICPPVRDVVVDIERRFGYERATRSLFNTRAPGVFQSFISRRSPFPCRRLLPLLLFLRCVETDSLRC